MSANILPLGAKLGCQDISDKSLFGLAFYDDVDPRQWDGLPPKTFFSHSSETVYSRSHPASWSVPSRV